MPAPLRRLTKVFLDTWHSAAIWDLVNVVFFIFLNLHRDNSKSATVLYSEKNYLSITRSLVVFALRKLFGKCYKVNDNAVRRQVFLAAKYTNGTIRVIFVVFMEMKRN